jgi:hypothetical protein
MKTNRTIPTVIITTVITIIIIGLIVYYLAKNMEERVIRSLTKETKELCEDSLSVTYRDTLHLPSINGIYEHDIAIALKDIAANTSQSNCQETTLPPPFTQYVKFYGKHGHKHGHHKDIFTAIGFWDTASNIACIGFTGTYGHLEWHDDAEIKLVPGVKLNGYVDGILVHKGYYEIYTSVRDELIAWYRSLGISNLFLTGSSMGGATSTLCAFDFASIVQGQLVHYSFASPRCGNVLFADTYDQRVQGGIRVYNTEDVVIALPPATFRGNTYKHVCASHGAVGFTKSLGSITMDHIDAYYDLP